MTRIYFSSTHFYINYRHKLEKKNLDISFSYNLVKIKFLTIHHDRPFWTVFGSCKNQYSLVKRKEVVLSILIQFVANLVPLQQNDRHSFEMSTAPYGTKINQ